jgi:FAD/FMN-containing dehydrogenase
MSKVEINLEEKSVTAQGGCVAADLEKPLEGNVYTPGFTGCVC